MGQIISIDDDLNFSLQLKEKLKTYFMDEILIFNKVDFDVLDTYVLDLVFLDIEMNDINGIEVAKKLKMRKDMPIIIFVSNREGLIHASLEVQPFYFVRKNHLDKDLDNAFCLLSAIKFRSDSMVKIGKEILDAKDIIYVESHSHNSIIHTKNGEYQQRVSLEKVAMILTTYQCLRIHRSFVVNVKYIEKWCATKVIMANGIEIEIGRKFQGVAKKKYQNMLLTGVL